jgi:hypothetical protein
MTKDRFKRYIFLNKLLVTIIVITSILGVTVSWVFAVMGIYLYLHLLFGPLDWYLYIKLYKHLKGE